MLKIVNINKILGIYLWMTLGLTKFSFKRPKFKYVDSNYPKIAARAFSFSVAKAEPRQIEGPTYKVWKLEHRMIEMRAKLFSEFWNQNKVLISLISNLVGS